MSDKHLEKLAKLIRYYSLVSTTEAGSGHPTSSLSATDLMTVLCFGGFFHFDLEHPENQLNDRLVFSKGHASPLFYALWAAAGAVTEKELLSLRKFGSVLEGHPVPKFKYTEAATGSLGQGLSVGVGMALNAKMDALPYRTYVLLGDSEMAEGSVWEAIQLAMHYKLDNLIGILDVNRLGQRGETMYGHKLLAYMRRITAFGWQAYMINGHNVREIAQTYDSALRVKGRPTLIIAKTMKGKGVKFLENKDGWHGKALKPDELKLALKDLGEVDKVVKGEIAKPPENKNQKSPFGLELMAERKIKIINQNSKVPSSKFQVPSPYATRKAYGDALVRIFPQFSNIVVLDAEVSNSTFSETFQKEYPKRFFEMYIAEQNMVGAALGLSRRGKIPFISTFAAFFTRAFDQIRMAQYSDANIKFCGSHAGVSIGEDGPSQMGLEDIAMFRTLLNSVVLYPCDAVSTHALVEEAAKYKGIVYIRTTRSDTPVLYHPSSFTPPLPQMREEGRGEGAQNDLSSPQRGRGVGGEGVMHTFRIGGSCTLRESKDDKVAVVAAGITLFEALAAYEELKKEDINIRVIDVYSIKPIDHRTLEKASHETLGIITVEDHFSEGGIGEAVRSTLHKAHVHSLAVRKQPMSGKPAELLAYEEINRDAIIYKVKDIIKLNLKKL